MTIYKTNNLVETYRAKASSKDINELTGRTGRPDLTSFVTSQMVSKIDITQNANIIDIGCGNGLFLQEIAEKGLDSYKGRLIGLLPTKEEVSRVRDHLLNDPKTKNKLISIELGLAEKTNLPDSFADIVVCNSVLHGAGQERNFRKLWIG
jgi:2-polyprenyl-3-methyl-5-hydroxy-6-metoxy-1,4-benzoquinol methylase